MTSREQKRTEQEKKESRGKIITIALVIITLLAMVFTVLNQRAIANKEKELSLIRERIHDFTWEGFNALPFGQAFNQMYFAYGEGHIFEWRNSKYKIILKEDS